MNKLQSKLTLKQSQQTIMQSNQDITNTQLGAGGLSISQNQSQVKIDKDQDRVHSMYKNVLQSEFHREKGLMSNCIEQAKNQSQKKESELQTLRDENRNLKQQFKRVKEMIDQQNSRTSTNSRGNMIFNDSATVTSYDNQSYVASKKGFGKSSQFMSNTQLLNVMKPLSNFGKPGQQQFTDIIKFEKFTMCLQNLFKIERSFDFILTFLEQENSCFNTICSEVKNIFECQKATLFVISKNFYKSLIEGVKKEKSKYIHSIDYYDSQSIEKTQLIAIARTEKELCDKLLFPSILQVKREAIRKGDSMCICVRYHKSDGELCHILQIEYESKTKENGLNEQKSQSLNRTQPIKSNKKGFSHSDEVTFRIISQFLQLRLEKHMLYKDVKQKIQDRQEAIQMANRICKLKTYKALMKGMHRELIQFLSFKECGIMFYDAEKQKLFTISIDQDEDQKLGDSSFKGQQNLDKELKQDITDLTLTEKQLIWFPCSMGQTGYAFKNNTYLVQNDGKKRFINIPQIGYQNNGEPLPPVNVEFMSDIDNSKGVRNLENYLIGSLQGGENQQANGIIQMFNFKSAISKIQIRRYDAISGFLGGCLANIADISRSITTMIGIQMVIDNCSESANQAEIRVEQNLAEIRSIIVPIDTVKKLTEYLEQVHTQNNETKTKKSSIKL
eukprot:403356949